jgi:hypothetical protein
MSEVWLIESGQYSNYGVLAVAASEEDAIEICRRANGALNIYEELSYSPRSVVTPGDVVLTYTAWVNPAGNVTESEAEIGFESEVEGIVFDAGPTVAARASSPERAKKIAQDRAAQRKAEALGL